MCISISERVLCTPFAGQSNILKVVEAYSFFNLLGKGPRLVLMRNILLLLGNGIYFALWSFQWIFSCFVLWHVFQFWTYQQFWVKYLIKKFLTLHDNNFFKYESKYQLLYGILHFLVHICCIYYCWQTYIEEPAMCSIRE